jgi:hypothetical protein
MLYLVSVYASFMRACSACCFILFSLREAQP